MNAWETKTREGVENALTQFIEGMITATDAETAIGLVLHDAEVASEVKG